MEDRTEDRMEDRSGARTKDRAGDRTGHEQYLLGLPLHDGHKVAVHGPAVVQGRGHLGNRVERTEERTGQDRGQDGGQDRGQDKNRTEDRTKDRAEDRTRDTTEDRTGQDRSSTCVFSHSTAAIRRLSAAQQWSMTEYT